MCKQHCIDLLINFLFCQNPLLDLNSAEIITKEQSKKSMTYLPPFFSMTDILGLKIRRARTRLPTTGEKQRNCSCTPQFSFINLPTLEGCSILEKKDFNIIYVQTPLH